MSKLASEVAKPASVEAFKGFDSKLQCRDHQYEVGKTYSNGGKKVTRCGEGAFHACDMPLDTWGYYGPANSKYALVSLGGSIARGGDDEDTKIASAEITINAEIKLPRLISDAVSWICEKAKGNGSVTTGYRAHAASTGDGAHAASTGNYAHAASTGNYAHAASTGNYAHAASTGYRAHAASTGNYAHAASTGYRAHAASTGDGAHAASTGDGAIAAALGWRGTAKAGEGGAISLAAYDDDVYPPKLVAVRSSMVGQNGIVAGKTYRLTRAGEFEEAA